VNPKVVRIAAAVLVAVLATSCVISTGDGSPGQGAPIDTVDAEAMGVDEKSAVEATDAFWRSRFPQLFGREYQPPRVEGRYVGENGPACADQPSVPFNAVYCPAGDFVAWDENLMAAGYSQIGDAWVYLIIAHEWGHAIQARLDRSLVSVAAELQADCLAGATLQGAAQDGILRIEPGDAEEIQQTLSAVADDYPWTDETDHGNAQQRITFFNKGVSGGVPACI
jgi:predicted metalloprotease